MLGTPALVKLGTGLLGLTAIALVAAILESPIEAEQGDGFAGQIGGGTSSPAATGSLPLFLEVLILASAILVAVLCAIYFLTHRRETLVMITGILVATLVMLAIVYGLVGILGFDDGTSSTSPPSENETGTEESGGDDGGGVGIGAIVYGLVVLGTFFVVFAVSLLYTRSPSSTNTQDPTDPEPEIAGDTAADLSGAAERVADRLVSMERTDLDDEIRRAWLDMTRLLDVERPTSRTPGEFADAAVEAGLDPDAVGELTALFEAVRYGRLESTPDREARAVETFRRIAGDEAGPGSEEGVGPATEDEADPGSEEGVGLATEDGADARSGEVGDHDR